MTDTLESFKSEIMREVIAHRGDPAVNVGLVDAFATAIDEHRRRYIDKNLDDATAQKINDAAELVIARARAQGRVTAFDEVTQ